MTNHIESVARTACAAALAVMAVGGCGTAPSSLRPMAEPASLQLKSPVTWTLTRNFHELHESLIAGTYVAVGESERGTYYTGPAPCLVEASMLKDRPSGWGGFARNCGIFKPRSASEAPTVFYVQDGSWIVTDFDPNGTPHLDDLKDHRDLGGTPDAAPPRTVLDPDAPVMPTATVAAAGHGPGVVAAGSALGTTLVAGIIAADIGTFHEVDTQPPAGWLAAALAPKTAN
jgi:hypothetical protein